MYVCMCIYIYIFFCVFMYVCINSWFLFPGENTTIDFEFNSATDIQDNRRSLFSQLPYLLA